MASYDIIDETYKTEIVSFEVAKLAFEAGFDRPCFLNYDELGRLENPMDWIGKYRFTIDDVREAFDNEHPSYLCPYQDGLSRWILDKYKLYPIFIF